MNKKLISMALTGVLAVGVLSVATPSVADARKTKPETSTDISVQRAPGESMVMTMSKKMCIRDRDDTDAVNVSQLKASNARIGDAIGQVAGEVQRVGAHAAAMAALKPIQYDPLEPTQVMAGVGNYRGETAAALGLAHYTNEDTMFNVGVSLGANRNMVNAGVTHKFGSSPEKKNIPDRYKAGPISSVYVMQDEVSSLKKENSEQKTVIADQAARLNTLEAENERQRQELAETKQGLEDLRAAVSQLLSSKG